MHIPKQQNLNVILLRVAHLKPRQPVKGLPCPLWTTRGLEVKHVLWTIIVHKLDSLPWESHFLGVSGGVFVWIVWLGLVHVHLYITKEIQKYPPPTEVMVFCAFCCRNTFFVSILSKKRMVRVSNSLAIFFRWVAMIHPLTPGADGFDFYWR